MSRSTNLVYQRHVVHGLYFACCKRQSSGRWDRADKNKQSRGARAASHGVLLAHCVWGIVHRWSETVCWVLGVHLWRSGSSLFRAERGARSSRDGLQRNMKIQGAADARRASSQQGWEQAGHAYRQTCTDLGRGSSRQMEQKGSSAGSIYAFINLQLSRAASETRGCLPTDCEGVLACGGQQGGPRRARDRRVKELLQLEETSRAGLVPHSASDGGPRRRGAPGGERRLLTPRRATAGGRA